MKIIFAILILLCASIMHCEKHEETVNAPGLKRTLVLIDNLAVHNTHSIFFSDLKSNFSIFCFINLFECYL
jgi:hypothetical protein